MKKKYLSSLILLIYCSLGTLKAQVLPLNNGQSQLDISGSTNTMVLGSTTIPSAENRLVLLTILTSQGAPISSVQFAGENLLPLSNSGDFNGLTLSLYYLPLTEITEMTGSVNIITQGNSIFAAFLKSFAHVDPDQPMNLQSTSFIVQNSTITVPSKEKDMLIDIRFSNSPLALGNFGQKDLAAPLFNDQIRSTYLLAEANTTQLFNNVPAGHLITALRYKAPCPDLSTTSPALPIITEKSCNLTLGNYENGVITAPVTTNCPDKTSLKYSTDGIHFYKELPTYDSEKPMTISTRCYCDENEAVYSLKASVQTAPANICPANISFIGTNELSFGDPCSCTDPQNCLVNEVVYFHDTLVIPSSGTIATGLDIRIQNSTNFYIDVPCVNGSFLQPTFGTAGTQILETAPGSGIYKIEFWRPSGIVPSIAVLESGNVTAAPSTTFEPVCNQLACYPELKKIPTLSQWGLLILGLLVLNVGLLLIKREEEILR